MFKKLASIFRSLKNDVKKYVDASRFNDAVAMATSWDALNTSTSNFDVRKLVVTSGCIKYKVTIQAKMFFGIFIVAGLGFLSFVGPRQYGRWIPESFLTEGLAQLVCLFFIAFGVFFLYYVSIPIEFIKSRSSLEIGRGKRRKSIAFSEIYAVQLIASTEGSDYYNYQLNIVFSNAERLNIVVYSNLDRACEEANIISHYIHKPLWKAV
ncbi:hypothetical protein [Gynuella sunshinyii]|uniref:Uncharacterized protein n=1 Tax=Gynuella sunshinyii YC6258 TaxID=1445510 RepID=A0A0C5VYT5_9GAMM|nr:hypothetical protein [Gynuella sunshinyii]AJQ95574.1 hypothetical Protein YC6258_03538 [Gynuella sunshinyii YC6258]